MPNWVQHDCGKLKRGDTWDGFSVDVVINGEAADLHGCSFAMDLKHSLESEAVALPLNLSSDANIISMDRVQLLIPIGKYVANMVITWPNGRVETYIECSMEVVA